jgi:hypothetical protein
VLRAALADAVGEEDRNIPKAVEQCMARRAPIA